MTRPLAGLSRHNLVTELMAGVTLLAIAVPLNIGYAQIAGMPPTVGLYALIVPGVVFALGGLDTPGGWHPRMRRRPRWSPPPWAD